jgi:uncharacterized membrane protein YebE (DUF533 family)
MDMIDILGGMLGQKSSRGGKGSDILKDMFGRGRSAPTQSPPKDISREAQELEDMLNVANDRKSSSRSQSSSPKSSSRSSSTHGAPAKQGRNDSADSERALILVRAMANAAKADGRVDQSEQQSILKHIQNPSADIIQFLQEEFRKPLNVREFAMSVPVGMEQQVYTLSLIAMDLDTGDEAKYMTELGDSLRLPADVREQIHQRVGAPSIY